MAVNAMLAVTPLYLVYLPFIGKTKYKGVTANIAFTAKGELTTPAVTLYTFKDNVRAALN